MNLGGKERDELIQHRLIEARESIEDVLLLLDNDRLRAAVNRIYYGMFYSLLALGLAYEFETSKHQQLLGWFNKNFVKTELIEKRFGKIIHKAFNRRTTSDYESFIEFDKKDILEMFDEMKAFIFEIEKLLDRKIKLPEDNRN